MLKIADSLAALNDFASLIGGTLKCFHPTASSTSTEWEVDAGKALRRQPTHSCR
jgi:hypothetical protein